MDRKIYRIGWAGHWIMIGSFAVIMILLFSKISLKPLYWSLFGICIVGGCMLLYAITKSANHQIKALLKQLNDTK